jgi:hypothetical protein
MIVKMEDGGPFSEGGGDGWLLIICRFYARGKKIRGKNASSHFQLTCPLSLSIKDDI